MRTVWWIARNFGSLLRTKLYRSRAAALKCWLAVFDLTARDIDNELGGLAEVAGALRMLAGHDRNYRRNRQYG